MFITAVKLAILAYAYTAMAEVDSHGRTIYGCAATTVPLGSAPTHGCTKPTLPYGIWYSATVPSDPGQPYGFTSEVFAENLNSMPNSGGCGNCGHVKAGGTCKRHTWHSDTATAPTATHGVVADAYVWADGTFQICTIACNGYLKVSC